MKNKVYSILACTNLLGALVIVFILGLTGTGFCVDLRGVLLQSNQQKLLELQNAENSSKMARIQSLKQQIQSRKLVPQVSCAMGVAAIKSAMPSEIFPGEPILIIGCGFKNTQGAVILNEYNAKLNITSWSDTAIEAVMPDDNVLNGFADPKNVSIRVQTAQGSVVGSQSILLRPSFAVSQINLAPSTLGGVTSQCLAQGTMHYVLKGNGQITCQGTDIYAIQLKNNWLIKEIVVGLFCNPFDSSGQCGFGLMGSSPQDCFSYGTAHYKTPDLSSLIGSKSLPANLNLDWSFTSTDLLCGISLGYTLFVVGPKGTNPY
jgi:hypothetical protein